MKNQEPPSKTKPRGPKAHPDIAKLTQQLGITKRRAQQLVKEASAAAPGDAQKYLHLRCKRMEQTIERAELELARLRAGDDDTISHREVRDALTLFLHYSQVFARRRAEEIAARPHSSTDDLYREMSAFSDGSHYAGIGSALMSTSPAFSQIWQDVLADGDGRYTRGTRLAEACRDRARDAAKVILGDWKDELFESCQRILSENIEGHRERLVELGADPDEG